MTTQAAIGIIIGAFIGFGIFVALTLEDIASELKRIRMALEELAPKKKYEPAPKYHPFYGHRIYHD